MPYISNGKAYFDIIDQSRLFISGIKGNRIYNATILADVQKQNERLYFRWADYTLKDGVHTIRNRATGESGNSIPLESIEAWTGIDEEIFIAGVDRLLFGFYKNVTDNRKDRDNYGVPITYGSESIIKQIHSHLNLIEREYKLTRPMLGLDAAMWNAGKISWNKQGHTYRAYYKECNGYRYTTISIQHLLCCILSS